jgi:hypothetical protein
MGFLDGIAGAIKKPYNPPRSNPGGKVSGRRGVKRGQTRAPERKPVYTPKRPTPPRRRSSGGGGGGGSYGGGGGGGGLTGTASGAVAAPAPAPSIGAFLGGDDTYQGQLAALTKAMANYRSQMGERQDEYSADFTRRLSDLNLTEDRSQNEQSDDFAGRGLLFSGLFGKARGDLERDFNNREGDMNLAKSQFMSGLNRDFTNFSEEQNLSREKAKSDAINRRALQYML